MVARELLERRPALAAVPDVLALVDADRAAFGRRLRSRELRRARDADRIQGVSR
jgi:hypothetical protein